MAYRTLDTALALAAKGFRVFRLLPGSKLPLSEKLGQTQETWPKEATTDPDKIRRLWGDTPYNIGIATGNYFVIDIDVKGDKNGLVQAELLGIDFNTFTVETPTGGLHLYYADENLATSASKLAEGIDTRGVGGYVVGPGSYVNGMYSVKNKVAPARVEDWIKTAVGTGKVRENSKQEIELADSESSAHTAALWLENTAPIAIEGQGGDAETFKVCAYIREFGLSEETALYLLENHWNDRCEPPWDHDDLARKVHNAYEYAQSDIAARDLSKAYEGLPSALTPVYDEDPDEDPKPKTFEIRALVDHKFKSKPDWLIKHLIPRIGVGVVYGAPSSGKTLAMQDICWSVAEKSHFLNMKVKAPGGVLILAPEAEELIGPRMEAAGVPESAPIVWADCPSFLAGPDRWQNLTNWINAGRKRLLEEYQAPLRLVVIDTYSASGAVEDENDNASAQKVFTTLKEYAKKAGVFIMAVHHTDKAGKDMRGAGAIRGAVDAAILVETTDAGQKKVSLNKSKMAAARELGFFKVNSHQIIDDDGEIDTIPVVKWLSEVDIPEIRPMYADRFMEAMETLHGEGSLADIKEAFSSLTEFTTAQKTGQVFNEVLSYLLKTNEISEFEGYFRRTK